jgi:hypothetical protein
VAFLLARWQLIPIDWSGRHGVNKLRDFNSMLLQPYVSVVAGHCCWESELFAFLVKINAWMCWQ